MLYREYSPFIDLPPDTSLTGSDASWQEASDYLRSVYDSTVVFDTDATLFDFKANRIRAGVEDLFTDIRDAGNEIHVWSMNSGIYASNVLSAHGLLKYVNGVSNKPPILDRTAKAAVDVLGFLPDITVDDLAAEKIDGVDFLLISPWAPSDRNSVTSGISFDDLLAPDSSFVSN